MIDILYEIPFVATIDNLDIDENIYEKMLNASNFERSMGYSEDGINRLTSIRTSSTAFTGDKFISLNSYILEIIKKNFNHKYEIENVESCQLTRYEVGQEYGSHFDYFNILGRPAQNLNDRKATFILYLNDDFTGGETYFDCLDITVKPKKGMALYFTYDYLNEDLKYRTRHAGLPVKSGTKNIATFWIK
jgi:prolyl 4-hydroxylase